MHCGTRNKRWRWGLGLALVVAITPGVTAGATTPSSGPQIPTVPMARAEVLRSEQRLVEAIAARDAAKRALAELDTTSARLVTELAEARADLRDRAAGAFVSQDPDETVLVLLGGSDLYTASARVNLMAHATTLSSRAIEHYNTLKRSVDPKIVKAGVNLQQLEQNVVDAGDAALAARANEAEAERQAELIATQARLARAAIAATTTTRAPATTTTVAPSVATADGAAPSSPTDIGAAPAPGPAPAAAAAPAPAPVPAPQLPAVPSGGPSPAQWAALRNCESSGNYRAVSASGKYRGAYQFDYRTWAGLGGNGDPAAASPAEQDARAKLLYAQRGWRPWPVCGRFLR